MYLTWVYNQEGSTNKTVKKRNYTTIFCSPAPVKIPLTILLISSHKQMTTNAMTSSLIQHTSVTIKAQTCWVLHKAISPLFFIVATKLHIQIPPDITWVSCYTVPLWLLQVAVLLRVLWGYSAATACTVAPQPSVTVVLKYPHSTLNCTATCSSHSGTA